MSVFFHWRTLAHKHKTQMGHKKDFAFLEIHTDKWDASAALQQAGKGMADVNKIQKK